ncbi:hypothetical protein INS49_015411 [Diaporthe citri]|uniref:uncharacterized protein n=1 Tax=Diaporthe citri TaxID=83186 RepID=UPI001C7FF360|nr:uncharacterized protein INS49_015411 [Diaporthe citri]KAG6356026.1 hypothetical protein INS49_015411 [Diaporthe citri]
MASYEPPHLTKLRAWNSATPRFLFRGFNEYSGGNKELNTPTAITPHAFLGKFVDIKNEKSVGSGVDTLSGPSPMTLNSMSLGTFQTEINRHLYGNKNIASHFSSWTADFQTAIRYSWGGRDGLN